MSGPFARVRLSIAVGALATMCATAAHAQAPGRSATPAELQQQITAVREQLRTMQEQQKALTATLDRLQQQLGDEPVPATTQPVPMPPAAAAPAQVVAAAPVARGADGSITQKVVERYQDGIVIWQTPNDAKVPFLLKYNINSQVRYLNTTSGSETFTDHLGAVRSVNLRNDITVNRTMFILGGYIFDPRLRYSTTVWTSAGSNSIVIAGNIGWQFNKAFTLTGGYTGVPGSRSLVNTFPRPYSLGADGPGTPRVLTVDWAQDPPLAGRRGGLTFRSSARGRKGAACRRANVRVPPPASPKPGRSVSWPPC